MPVYALGPLVPDIHPEAFVHPDAVVIDLHMPIVDGVTAVARLRKDHPSLCLIALTGDDDSVLHEAVTEAGADAVLLKSDLVDRRSWPTKGELRTAVFDYIECFYNRQRRHSSLDYLSPAEYEKITERAKAA